MTNKKKKKESCGISVSIKTRLRVG